MANAASPDDAAKALKAKVVRLMGNEVPMPLLTQMTELYATNMGEFASKHASEDMKGNIRDRQTRIIAVIRKERRKDTLVAFAAYRLNCNEDGMPVAYLYELQVGVEARGSKPSLGKALLAEAEQRARLSGSGRLRLSVHENNVAVGFYRLGCGYTQIGTREEQDPTQGTVRLCVMEKDCRADFLYADVQEEEEQQERMEQQQVEEDDDLDDENEELEAAPVQVGNVLTAIKVWTTSIAFWATISAPIAGPKGDYDRAKLKEYAEKGQAAGKAWALAIQAHSHNTCSWQYVHDTFAHVSCRPPPRALAPLALAAPPLPPHRYSPARRRV